MTTRVKYSVIFAVLALFAAGLGISFYRIKPHFDPTALTGTVVEPARAFSDFSLRDDQNQPFTRENFLGHWSLVFFGFTRCQMVCPTVMAELSKLYNKLANDNIIEPEFVMISLDPERDTVKQMQQYVTGFNQHFRGVTGNKDQIVRLAKEMNVMYLKMASQDNKKDYNIDHSGTLMLLNPEGKIQAFFTMPHEATVIAHDFKLIAAHYS